MVLISIRLPERGFRTAYRPRSARIFSAARRCGLSTILPSIFTTPEVGLSLNAFHDLRRPGDFLVRRHEGRIDHVDMLGMDHRLGEAPVLPRGSRLLPLS